MFLSDSHYPDRILQIYYKNDRKIRRHYLNYYFIFFYGYRFGLYTVIIVWIYLLR